MRLATKTFLFALLGLVSLTYAAPTTPYSNCGNPQAAANLGAYAIGPITLWVAAIALMLSIDVVAIGYIISKTMPTLGVSNWLQAEYWEVFKSAMLIVGTYSLLIFLSNIAFVIHPSVISGAGSSSYITNINGLTDTAEAYLNNVAQNVCGSWDNLGNIMTGVGWDQYNAGTGFTIGLYLPIPIPLGEGFAILFGTVFHPYANLVLQTGNFIIAPYTSLMTDVVSFLLFPISMLVFGLQAVLPTLVIIGLGIFIPLGIIFRAFPFVRGIGGMMYAIGLALAVVFPTLLILFNYTTTVAFSSNVPNYSLGGVSCPFSNFVIGPFNAGDFLCSRFQQIIGTGGLFANIGAAMPYAFEAYGNVYPFLNAIVDNTMFIVFQLILFAIDLIIMYSVTDAIARSLGGTIKLSLGDKLHLAH